MNWWCIENGLDIWNLTNETEVNLLDKFSEGEIQTAALLREDGSVHRYFGRPCTLYTVVSEQQMGSRVEGIFIHPNAAEDFAVKLWFDSNHTGTFHVIQTDPKDNEVFSVF